MTNNMDEFDQDQFDPSESTDGHAEGSGKKPGLGEAWRNKPILKLLVIMVGVGAALALVMGTVTSDKKPIQSNVATAPDLSEPPGGTASPFFIEQNSQANHDRADAAMQVGGSALPTPVGRDMTAVVDKNKKDPMVEFKEETERLKQELRTEQQQNTMQLQAMQQKMAAQPRNDLGATQDESLARAMQKQMETLMESWTPRSAKVVNGYGEQVMKDMETKSAAVYSQMQGIQDQASAQAAQAVPDKVIVPSGTVNYVQLLTEANSDIPGPILAQILSGPLSGGRAIGRFQVLNDFLVMSFSVVSLKGKEYAINAIALDPDTTLGGLATEVDHRYLTRVLLPAAGAFVQAFGQSLSETDTTTTVTDGSVLQDKAKKGGKEAMYAGIGQAGQTLQEFFQSEANNTKTLVRVAVGTPMGMFFLAPVTTSGHSSSPAYGSQGGSAFDTSASNQGNGPYRNKASSSMDSTMKDLPPQQAQMLQNMMTMMSSSSTGTSRATGY